MRENNEKSQNNF